MKEINNIPKHQGFTTPDAYFSSNRERLLVAIALEKEVSPATAAGFEVPDGYFKEHKEKVLQTLSRKRTPTQKTSTLKKLSPYLYTGMAIAASLLLLVSILNINTETAESDLEYALVADYFETDEDLEDIQFEEWLSIEDIESLEQELSFEDTATLDYLEDRTTTFDLYTD